MRRQLIAIAAIALLGIVLLGTALTYLAEKTPWLRVKVEVERSLPLTVEKVVEREDAMTGVCCIEIVCSASPGESPAGPLAEKVAIAAMAAIERAGAKVRLPERILVTVPGEPARSFDRYRLQHVLHVREAQRVRQ